MTKKRRMFDIDMPEDAPLSAEVQTDQVPETIPVGKVGRRGPMAAAINEAAQSARERQELEHRIRAENDALAHEHVRLKKLGLVMSLVPVDQIEAGKLVRDRSRGPDPDLGDLAQSISKLGLSNPIRLESQEDGRYELIQGYRRLSAYRSLLEETGDADRWGTIPAVVVQPGEELERLYRLMVDENLVRKDISFAEMAQLALDYAADPQTRETDPEKVVAQLFGSAGYQKRSYIRGFIKLLERVGPHLKYPSAIPRALGLSLHQRLEAEPALAQQLRREFEDWDNRSEQDELSVLRRLSGADKEMTTPPAREVAPLASEGKAKTSFQIDRHDGRAKCTAANGRLEIRLSRDFTMIDRRRLELAVAAMLDTLEN